MPTVEPKNLRVLVMFQVRGATRIRMQKKVKFKWRFQNVFPGINNAAVAAH